MGAKRLQPLLLAEDSSYEESVARPFLKWAGGKRQVLQHLHPRLLPVQGRYHEPFLGGGAVFLSLGELPGGALLSDTNSRLVRSWIAVRDDTEALIEVLAWHLGQHSEEHFYAQRERDIDAQSDIELAGWMIYLNKAGFNGLYRVNRKGKFNVPWGKVERPGVLQPGRLRAISRMMQGVQVLCQDFEQACQAVRPGDTVYFDPPYIPVGHQGFTKYTAAGFGKADQQRLANLALSLKQQGVTVVLSNHEDPEIERLYPSPFSIDRVSVARRVNRDATKRGGVTEVIIW